MKHKTRLSLVVCCLVVYALYSLWKLPGFQDISDLQIRDTILSTPFSGESVSPCTEYFDTLEKVASLSLTTSRYISRNQIRTHIVHLRAYLRCLLWEGTLLDRNIKSWERTLLPMFTGKDPVVSPHSGVEFPEVSTSYWKSRIDALKGRGIVIGVHDRDVNFAKRLLKVLAYLENDLPIEFVHEGGLSLVGQDTLKNAAGGQTVRFIDVRPAVTRKALKAYGGYNNKWLAVLFNSFQEIILMDADAVPFVKPSTWFDKSQYTNTGALFFRDRELATMVKQSSVDFFGSMIPTGEDYFEISVNKEKLDNNFFNLKAKHVMESGVVVIDRSSHLNGLLISATLQYFWRSGRIMYGDKDLFWLGQLISGNSKYEFNQNAAGAIGKLENDFEICLSQLAHLDETFKLQWTNGALLFCKRNTYLRDWFFKLLIRKEYSIESARVKYSLPIEVDQVVLPAAIAHLNDGTQKKLKANFGKRDNRGCGSIFYCANLNDGGKLIDFLDGEVLHYRKIVEAWNRST